MRTFHVLNLGAGVQSTVLFLLALGPEPKLLFDVAVFADTGEEPSAVYRHLDHLKTLGGPPIWVRSTGKLGDDLMHGRNSAGQRFASIPAFTKDEAGKVGMVRRQCTKEYKVEVVNKAIRRELLGLKPRQRVPKDVLIHQLFRDQHRRGRPGRARQEAVRERQAHGPDVPPDRHGLEPQGVCRVPAG